MDTFLLGMAFGIASAIALFVLINLEIPSGLDKIEEGVREHSEGYKAKKTSLGAWIKSKFRRG